MHMTKLGAVLASLAITAGTAAVVAEAPARADTTGTTPTTVQLSFTDSSTGQQYSAWRALYGSRVATLTTTISDGTDAAPTVGSAILKRKLPGGSWKTQATDADLTDGATFTSPRALGNAQYRVEYTGGDDTATGGTTAWAASTSNVVQVMTYWNFHAKGRFVGRQGVWYGTLSPHVRNHRILIQVKRGSWQRYRVIRTDRKSHWSVRVTPGHNRYLKYRAVVAGSKKMQKSYALAKFELTYHRAPAPTSARVLIRR
jgi:hypothetical protein